jgi:hypothetical protein
VKKAAGAVAPLPSTSGPPVSEEKEARIIRNVEPGD